ncbi:hypothetical protein BC938DRAFT_481033 [Jimgerdemannia flammicorona]|uniref:Uncharacterized protein n=1 Tax=Jimgerdemannia flammicorona TaxID=994334 RepID=A0A433QHU7_9FUNG|nr:hypothetical protein BC938DRAFT_481033 [Jimgerdemannia flammicorona]
MTCDISIKLYHLLDSWQLQTIVNNSCCFPTPFDKTPNKNLTTHLLQTLLKRSPDGHDFADRLHGRADMAVDILELAQVPPGDLGDDVVERGLEARRRRLGYSVGQIRQRVT